MTLADLLTRARAAVALIPFNPGNRKTQALVAIFLLLFIAALATRCHAAEPYAQFGVGSTIIRGPASALDLSVVYPEAGPEDSDYALGITFVGASLYGTARQPGQFMIHGDMIDGFGPLDLGLGIAWLQNTDAYDGSHMNFSLSAAYRFHALPLTLVYRHFSNAGTAAPNVGRDSVFLAWRFGGVR